MKKIWSGSFRRRLFWAFLAAAMVTRLVKQEPEISGSAKAMCPRKAGESRSRHPVTREEDSSLLL